MIALVEATEFTTEDVITLAKNAFDIAWIDEVEKQKYIEQIYEFVKKYNKVGNCNI